MSDVSKAAFLITIDTEGDSMWSRPREIETRNAEYLPRFQELCERFGFHPTWLTNYEMAMSDTFCEFGRDVIRRGTGEIGMHLHAWNSPPLTPLTDDDMHHQPFLIEYPAAVIAEKVGYMTGLLEDTFGVPIESHRAGRWAFNSTYARALTERGYKVDCSVTPTVSWVATKGDPAGSGGTDYSRFPASPYFVDLDDPSRPGSGPLLEVPMSIVPLGSAALFNARNRLSRLPGLARVKKYGSWLRPTPGNLKEMLAVADSARRSEAPHLEFMLHSSEFMPGGNPHFTSKSSIDALFDDLEVLFGVISRGFGGWTLGGYAAAVRAGRFPTLNTPATA